MTKFLMDVFWSKAKVQWIDILDVQSSEMNIVQAKNWIIFL